MAEYRRIIMKVSDVTTEVATVPATNDHTDGSWLDTDIYKGELFINLVDDVVQTRTDSGIITLSGSSSSLLDGIVTIELDRTFGLTDSNKLIRLDGTTDRVWTVPPNSSVAFPIGTQILLERVNTAELDIAEGSGVTVNSVDGKLSLRNQYSGAVLVKSDTDEWELFGDLKA